MTDTNRCHFGDCRDVMRDLISQRVRVQCVVTSPPYWGLRDYGHPGQLGLEALHDCLGWATGARCGMCHVCRMVEVFTLVGDLLSNDGVLWLNYGDSYYSPRSNGGIGANSRINGQRSQEAFRQASRRKRGGLQGLKPKDLAGIPWRIAFALQAAGWYLRQDIIWHKPNPMPESIRDRCTKAHEYLFLLARSERYYYDIDAIKEPVTGNAHARGEGINPKAAKWKTPDGWDTSKGDGGHGSFHRAGREKGTIRPKQNESFSAAVSGLVENRNKRSVWTVPTQAFSDAHFATFPTALVEPCILAGSRPGDIVFDPFFGSGTVGEVAQQLGRRWLGCEINPDYAPMQQRRTGQMGMAL